MIHIGCSQGEGVEYGENLPDALLRELKEEACVKIEPGDLLFVTDTIAPDGSRHLVQCCFEARIVDGDVALGIDERVVEVRFVSLKDLQGLDLRPDIRKEISSRIRGRKENSRTYLGMRWRSGS